MQDPGDTPSDGQILRRMIRQTLPIGLVRVDRSMFVLIVNDAFAALAGIPDVDAAAGARLPDVLHPASMARLRPLFDDALDGRASQRALVLDHDGHARPVQADFRPELDHDGRVYAVIGMLTDTRPSREHEQERLAAFAQVRDQMLAVVSHELRSPLNAVQSWSHVLENQLAGAVDASPVVARALAGIRAGIAQQVRLIDRLLDATTAMTGELRIASGPLIVRRVIEAAIATARARAGDRTLVLRDDLAIDDEAVEGDAHRIGQILDELLDNAIACTPEGGSITVRATASPHSGRLKVSVADTGRGLAAGFDDWLFEPFRHAASAATRRSGGFGIGLALARRLAVLQGGTLEAASDGPERGATFTLTLPLSVAAATGRASLRTGASSPGG